jgi:outer membrane protein TolC
MAHIKIKKWEKFIFRRRLQAGFIIRLIISSYIAFFFYPFADYAAAANSLAGSYSREDLSSAEEQSEIIEKYLQEAQTRYEKGRYYEAIKLWSEVLTIDPANQKAKEAIERAEKKIVKIKAFFGRDVFTEQPLSELSLLDCIEIAEESSLLFQIAKEQINLAKIKVWTARREFFPSLTLSWAETKGIRSGGKIEGMEYGIEGKQPTFRSGELVYTLAQSKTNLKIAGENYDNVELDLWYDVSEVYYAFVKAKKFLKYMKKLYEDIKPFYEIAKKKHEEKLIPDIEHLEVESSFNTIYYKSIAAESDFEIAKLSLEQKLNIERSGTIDVTIDILQRGVDKDLNTCLLLAIENRPDLKITELSVKSSEYGKKIAGARGLPRVDLAGHWKRSSEVYKKDFDLASRDEASLDPKEKWYAGIEVSWPFLGSTGTYSLYKRKDPSTLSTYYGAAESKGTSWQLEILDNLGQFSDTQEAEIAHVRAEEQLNEMRKKVVKEVKDAYYGYEKARIQLEAAKVQKKFNEKEIEILKLKHGLGDTTIADLFKSFIHLMEGNGVFFEAERESNTAVAKLNKAIGMEDYF